jgi:hypothetical protein
MPFLLSPGVNVSEVDLTTIVPSTGTTEGGFCGNFEWGPANQIVTITNEIDLVNMFGRPTTNTFTSFFTAANFLSYASNLQVVRAINVGVAKNADSNGAGTLIRNKDEYVSNFLDTATVQGTSASGFATARFPGALGNSLQVSILTSNTSSGNISSWAYGSFFEGQPNTSSYVSGLGGGNDEMHVVVIDRHGRFTGTSNTVLEKFGYVSVASDAKTDDGSSNYYVNVINDRSKYVYITGRPEAGISVSNWGNAVAGSNTKYTSNASIHTVSLGGGVSALATANSLTSGYDLFRNGEEVDVSLIVMGDAPPTVSKYVVDNIAEGRKDALVFISPERSDVVNNDGLEPADSVAHRNTFNSSSYAVMDSGWKYQFDKYNNVYRWVPLNGDIAGLCVRTDLERDPWFSPAGFNRGSIKNVTKLAWNPNKAERDTLYKNGINPVVSFPGEGVVLYGDKTMLSKPSAFDRINVRRLFIVLEKAIARAARYSLFEFNDEFTRAQFVALVEPFLRDVQGRRGIYDYRVVCDETNNTPEIIDGNEFVGDIYIKPARSINFIQLNFVAGRIGVAFEEIVGRF